MNKDEKEYRPEDLEKFKDKLYKNVERDFGYTRSELEATDRENEEPEDNEGELV